IRERRIGARCDCRSEFGALEDGLSTSAHKINVEPVSPILADLPNAESSMLNPIFWLPIHNSSRQWVRHSGERSSVSKAKSAHATLTRAVCWFGKLTLYKTCSLCTIGA